MRFRVTEDRVGVGELHFTLGTRRLGCGKADVTGWRSGSGETGAKQNA